MNHFLFLVLLIALGLSIALALRAQPFNPPAVVSLAWTIAPGANTNTAGYWIWQGANSGDYVRTFFVPGWATTTSTIPVTRGETLYWNITAWGTNASSGLESTYDGEAWTNVPAPPNPTTGLRIISGP